MTNQNKLRTLRSLILTAVVLATTFGPMQLIAQDSNWIWSPRQDAKNATGAECFFRKQFTLVRPEESELTIAASDEYELYINGREASTGASYGNYGTLNINTHLESGVNLISVRVKHRESEMAGLAIKLRIKEKGETRWRSLITDESWKCRLARMEGWESTGYSDLSWLTSQIVAKAKFGANPSETVDAEAPAEKPESTTIDNQTPNPSTVQVSQESVSEDRFEISNEFTVQQMMLPDETGSLIAIEFNEFGKLLLSREGGPLLIADPSKPLEHPERIRVLCDQVNTCQGILALNGSIYVTGQGPEGLALYRLTDANRDGMYETNGTLLKFTGQLGEHGPHGLTLGADGMIYVVIGNGSQVQGDVSNVSAYTNTYEGDLVPRYEDPGGHAEGVKAPGGTIVRVSVDGTRVERVAGGLRNCYDLVFNADGELFTHDSDMESDKGMSWYRPTMVFHVPDGAEFGWRSGWSKFPEYYLDQTPPVCKTGRGSPTGAVVYQHIQFPKRYHDTIFMADWSEGRILALRTKENGAGFTAQTEEFMKGKPLNVCDLAIGQDGALYFCTGGRGTAGGVYRVVWNGRVPENVIKFDNDLEKVVRHPQPNSAWARQNISKIKDKFGLTKWNNSIVGVATQTKNPVKFRTEVMDKMVLYGPFPNAETLTLFSNDESPKIRAKAAQLCGLKMNQAHLTLLGKLIEDKDPRVRRKACEGFIRLGEDPSVAQLVPMLASIDRTEAQVARRALEKIPAVQWKDELIKAKEIRVFIQSSLALMVSEPSLENAYAVLAGCSSRMDSFINDRDFVDLMRVVQLSLVRGKVDPQKIPAFSARVANEFPSGNGIINRELSRIMAYLKIGSVEGRIGEYLQTSEDSGIDKKHVAMYLQTIGKDLDSQERLALIDFLEQAYDDSGGDSYKYYLSRAIREVTESVSVDELKFVLRNGARMPNAAVATFYKLPHELDDEYVDLLTQLDVGARNRGTDESNQVRLGVIALLAQCGNEHGMAYLRQLWQDEPERRGDISIGLAQEPAGENWAYLVSSLPVLDDMTSTEVLDKLASVNRRPRDAGHYREVIELGYRLRADGAKKAARLLNHWAGESVATPTDDWQTTMGKWKNWFESRYPNETVSLENDSKIGNYSTEDLLSFIESNGLGSPDHGKNVYSKAQCALCHRMGANGVAAGPDLTSLARRFSNREILDSIVHPSAVVSDQYRSMSILTVDGEAYTGMASEHSDGSWLVLQADGKRVRIEKDEVDEIKGSELSSMPARLLDGLTMKEVADLMAYLRYGDNKQSNKEVTPADVR